MIHSFKEILDPNTTPDVFICLDNFHGILHNKGIRNKLEAWLTFLSVDEPELSES